MPLRRCLLYETQTSEIIYPLSKARETPGIFFGLFFQYGFVFQCQEQCFQNNNIIFAKLLLWIIARIYTPIFNFYNSTNLPAFTIQCPYFQCDVARTCQILIQRSMCFHGVKCDMLKRNTTFLFCAFLISIHIWLSNFLIVNLFFFSVSFYLRPI